MVLNMYKNYIIQTLFSVKFTPLAPTNKKLWLLSIKSGLLFIVSQLC